MTVAIYSWAGMGNLGDDWLLQTALRTAINYGLQPTVLLEPQAQIPDFARSQRVLKWPRVRDSATRVYRFRTQLRQHSCLLFAGGGWFAGDRGAHDPLLWLRRMVLTPIPVRSLGLGVGPFPTPVARRVGRAVAVRMGHRGAWNVRTIADGQALATLGVTNFSVSSDLALLSPRQPATMRDTRARRGLLVSLPSPQNHWSRTSADAWGRRLKANVGAISSGEPIRFVSFQQGDALDSQFWSQYFSHVMPVKDVGEYQELLSDARCAVVGRLHAGIAAALTAVPEIVVLGYHHKFDVLARLGLVVNGIDGAKLRPSSPEPARVDAERRAAVDSARMLFRSIT